jgi:hypothetical protein
MYSHLPPPVTSYSLEIAVITQAAICVGIGLGGLIWPVPDVEEDGIGAEIIYMVMTGHTRFLLALLSLRIAIYRYIPQIRTVVVLKDPGSISISSLILQVIFSSRWVSLRR